MESNRKYFYIFVSLTALFILFTVLYIGPEISLQFNTNDTDPYVFSKFFIVVVFGLLSYFVGYQLYDEKNKGDYTRWYVIAIVLLAIEVWILITNI